MRVLITGAAGNLGGMLARYLIDNTGYSLNLMVHNKPLPVGLAENVRAKVYSAILANNPVLPTLVPEWTPLSISRACYSKPGPKNCFRRLTRHMGRI